MSRSNQNLHPPIFKDEVLDRIGGDDSFLAELLEMYDAEFAEKSAGLAQAVQAKEFTAILTLGHSLKGSSANLSLPGLRDEAFAMETAGQTKDLARAEMALSGLRREYKRLKDFLARA
jgi:HPt (histidine-containing phosphotransfer) domain-containing protein